MEIEHSVEFGGYVRIPALIFHPAISKKEQPITLWIDTGASKTTILEDYAWMMKINFSNLMQTKRETQVVGGTVRPYIMNDVTFAFLEKDTKNKVLQTLKQIHIIKPPEDMTADDLKYPTNLFGLDLLRRFHFEYNLPTVKLELKKKYYVREVKKK